MFLLLAPCVQPDTLVGRVVGIADGDTITVLDAAHTQYKIRLAGIDAPEKRQPFGQRSKQSLSNLVYRQDVVVEWNKRDRYGRIVGKVSAPGGADVCLEQVRGGMAWHYEREQSPEDRRSYAETEQEARAAERGLWQDALPLPPWEWRQRR